jgi:F-type H+-transporting ATPase subunit epsilon
MADSGLQLELVAADRLVWSGQVSSVITRTTEGELGILANHAPLMAVLVGTTVEARTTDGERWVAAIDGGFLSVANNRVSILSADAELSNEIDVEAARRDLEEARTTADDDGVDEAAVRHAEARIQAVEKAS